VAVCCGTRPQPRPDERALCRHRRSPAIRGGRGVGVARLGRTSEDERRRGAGFIVDALLGRSALRSGLGRDEAVDLLWTFAASDQYRRLVGRRGSTIDRYERWLGDTLCAQLLPPPAGKRAIRRRRPRRPSVRRAPISSGEAPASAPTRPSSASQRNRGTIRGNGRSVNDQRWRCWEAGSRPVDFSSIRRKVGAGFTWNRSVLSWRPQGLCGRARPPGSCSARHTRRAG
jgi:hypothetical protein